MLAYPIRLEDDDGTVLVTSPDFPELTTFGEDRDEALERARDALEEAIAARIHDGKEIPSPTHGSFYATLPTLTAVKVMLYQGMRGKLSRPSECLLVSPFFAETARKRSSFLFRGK